MEKFFQVFSSISKSHTPDKNIQFDPEGCKKGNEEGINKKHKIFSETIVLKKIHFQQK